MTTQTPAAPQKLKRNRRLMMAVICAHIVLGIILSWWIARWVDTEMRIDLLRQTRLLAETVNPDRLRQLSGSDSDLARPEYRRLKHQFASVARLNETCRFIYLLGRSDTGQLCILVDSLPDGSPQARQPGEVYAEAPKGFLRAMETGDEVVEGPFTDRWGKFISGCVPVKDPAGTVVALLVMDFDAWEWKFGLAPAVKPLAVLTLLLFAILSIGAVLSYYRHRIPGGIPRWMRYLELVLVAEVGLTLTVFAAWTAHLHEQHRRQGIFAQLAASRTLAISQTMRSLRDTELESLGRFFECSSRVTPDEFYRFAGFLTQSRVVQGWGWAPAVPAAEKALFEHAANAKGDVHFSIWQQAGDGSRAPASGREAYYPVELITPLELNGYAVGFDLGSEPVRRAALDEALRSGLTTGSDPITLIQDNAGYRGILVLRPVYEHKNPGHLRGFAFAFLRVEKLLESAGPNRSTTRLAITLLRPNGSSEALASFGSADRNSNGTLSMVRPVLAFDKTFALNADASDAFLRLHPARESAYAAVLGVLITAALTCIFALLLRTRTVPDQGGGEGRGLQASGAWLSGAFSSRNPMPKRRRLPRRVRRSGHAARRA